MEIEEGLKDIRKAIRTGFSLNKRKKSLVVNKELREVLEQKPDIEIHLSEAGRTIKLSVINLIQVCQRLQCIMETKDEDTTMEYLSKVPGWYNNKYPNQMGDGVWKEETVANYILECKDKKEAHVEGLN